MNVMLLCMNWFLNVNLWHVLKAMHAVVLPRVLQWIRDTRLAMGLGGWGVGGGGWLPVLLSKLSLRWLTLTKCIGLWPPYLARAAQSNSSSVPLQIRMKEKCWFSLFGNSYYYFF